MTSETKPNDWSLLSEAFSQIARLERMIAELLLKNERLREQVERSRPSQ